MTSQQAFPNTSRAGWPRIFSADSFQRTIRPLPSKARTPSAVFANNSRGLGMAPLPGPGVAAAGSLIALTSSNRDARSESEPNSLRVMGIFQDRRLGRTQKTEAYASHWGIKGTSTLGGGHAPLPNLPPSLRGQSPRSEENGGRRLTSAGTESRRRRAWSSGWLLPSGLGLLASHHGMAPKPSFSAAC